MWPTKPIRPKVPISSISLLKMKVMMRPKTVMRLKAMLWPKAVMRPKDQQLYVISVVFVDDGYAISLDYLFPFSLTKYSAIFVEGKGYFRIVEIGL
jgi:hypothetical protein